MESFDVFRVWVVYVPMPACGMKLLRLCLERSVFQFVEFLLQRIPRPLEDFHLLARSSGQEHSQGSLAFKIASFAVSFVRSLNASCLSGEMGGVGFAIDGGLLMRFFRLL